MRSLVLVLFLLFASHQASPAQSTNADEVLTGHQIAQLAPGEFKIAARVQFEAGQTELDEPAREILRTFVAEFNKTDPSQFSVEVEAHADRTGNDALNREITERRAALTLTFVLQALSEQGRTTPGLVRIRAFGSRFAWASPQDGDRRVDILVRRLAVEVAADENESQVPPPLLPVQEPPSKFEPEPSEVLTFDHASPDVAIEVDDPRLSLATRGAIDFWVKPGWSAADQLQHDPTIVALSGPKGALAAIMISRDNQALLTWDGNEGPAVGARSDFRGGRLRHVAVGFADGSVTLYVDGYAISSNLPFAGSEAAVNQIDIGALASGDLAFVGQIARVRFWSEAINAADARWMMENGAAPAFEDTLFDAYVGGVSTPAEERPQFSPTPPTIRLAGKWWMPQGARELGLINQLELSDGPIAPLIAPLFEPTEGYRPSELETILAETDQRNQQRCPDGDDCSTDAERAADAKAAIGETVARHEALSLAPDSASYPLLQFVPVASADPERLAPGVAGEDEEMIWATVNPDLERVLRLRVWSDERLQGLQLVVTDGSDTGPSRTYLLGNDRIEDQDGGLVNSFDEFLFHPHEQIIALTGKTQGDSLNSVRIITTHGAYGPFGDDDGGKLFEMRLPLGVPFRGLAAPSTQFAEIGFVTRKADFGEGLAMVAEDGRAVRFIRTKRNTYTATSARLPLAGFRPEIDGNTSGTGFDAVPRRQKFIAPELTLAAADRIRVAGYPRDFVLTGLHPRAARDVRFDDTFVSLSKAVNLQANYSGYDITRMDPIHLTYTGVTGRVFQMPSGESSDYYDANRIFIPKGMIYTPLFTGKAHTHTTSAVTLNSYKKSFSRTVGVELGGEKALASFSFSDTVKSVRGSFHEQETVHTTGLSQIYFYALSLDQAQIDLTPAFRKDVEELAISGNLGAFIDTYGTHYAANVFYGGLGVLQLTSKKESTGTSSSDLHQISLKAKAVIEPETSTALGGNYSTTTEEQREARKTFGDEVEDFYWVGGTHMGMDRSHWSVGPDGAVPVHVDLRRIEELLTPFHFDDPMITQIVRHELGEAIDQRLEQVAELERRLSPVSLHRFNLKIDKLVCVDPIPDWDGRFLGFIKPVMKLLAFDNAAGPVDTKGGLADGVAMNDSKLQSPSILLHLAGTPLEDQCTEETHKGKDILDMIENDRTKFAADFKLREADFQTGGAFLDVRILAATRGYFGDQYLTRLRHKLGVQSVVCGPEAAGTTNYCEPKMLASDETTRTYTYKVEIPSSLEGGGKLRLDYTLSYFGANR